MSDQASDPLATLTVTAPEGWQPQARINGEWVTVEAVRYAWPGDPAEALHGWHRVGDWIPTTPGQDPHEA